MVNDISDTNKPPVDGVQPTQEVDGATVQPQAVHPEVISFYERYRLAMLAWTKEKGNTNFPIGEVPKLDRKGQPVFNEAGNIVTVLKWFNREERKKIMKARAKNQGF